MIRSFKGRDTQEDDVSFNHRVAAFQGFADQAARRLTLLDAAETLRDLAALPSNRLEVLRGDRAGQHSIRINMQWRHLLSLVGRWAVRRGDRRLPLRISRMSVKSGMRPVHPGEILREELGTIGLSARRAGKGVGRAGEPSHDDTEWTAGCKRRYSAQAGAVFRNHPAALDEPARPGSFFESSWYNRDGASRDRDGSARGKSTNALSPRYRFRSLSGLTPKSGASPASKPQNARVGIRWRVPSAQAPPGPVFGRRR